MAKPTQDITWAKGASPNTNEPVNERSNGYPNGFKVPSAAHNWQFEAIGDWISYLTRSAGQFETVWDFLAENPSDGDTFVLAGSLDNVWGGALSSTGLVLDGAVGWIDACTDGQYLIALEDGVAATTAAHVTIYDPGSDTIFSDFAVGTAALGANGVSVCANGTYVAVSFDDTSGTTYIYDYAGTEKFNFTHGGALYANCIDDARVYVCGQNGTTNYDVRAYDIVAETQTWGYDHGANLYAIATDGSYVYTGGDVSGGVHLRRLGAGNGSLDQSAFTTDIIEYKRRIAVGENSVYVLTQNAGTGTLREFTKTLSGTSSTFNLGAGFGGISGPETIAVDDQYVYVGGGTSNVLRSFSVGRDLALANRFTSTSGDLVLTLAHEVWTFDGSPAAPSSTKHRRTTARRAGVFRYSTKPGRIGSWFQQKFIPGI